MSDEVTSPLEVISIEPAHVQVVRGAPDDDELAALVAGLAAAAGGGATDAAPAPALSAWTDRSRALRHGAGPHTPAAPGPDTWRWSLRA
ncbi:acyl-CoA carboxylase epsilon subunit [Pengzhenrongella sp.]|uniref:acyl-CoA carboxylase epsilon subunit n=1 Tax=Pengzhenrongella sp. TaxID=2888820 RepID=UPI002F94D3D2